MRKYASVLAAYSTALGQEKTAGVELGLHGYHTDPEDHAVEDKYHAVRVEYAKTNPEPKYPRSRLFGAKSAREKWKKDSRSWNHGLDIAREEAGVGIDVLEDAWARRKNSRIQTPHSKNQGHENKLIHAVMFHEGVSPEDHKALGDLTTDHAYGDPYEKKLDR